MAHIVIKFKDGQEIVFQDETRSGGSYENEVTYEGAFLIYKDVWGSTRAFPAADIAEVKMTPRRF